MMKVTIKKVPETLPLNHHPCQTLSLILVRNVSIGMDSGQPMKTYSW